jgi:hypothetical protein
MFSRFPKSPRHVAVLTLLRAQPRFVEIITPFKKRLQLLTNYSHGCRVAMSTHVCSFYLRLFDSLMWRWCSVRPPNLSVWSKVATSTSDTKCLFSSRLLFRLFGHCLVQILEVKRLRIVTSIAKWEFPFDAAVSRLRYYS